MAPQVINKTEWLRRKQLAESGRLFPKKSGSDWKGLLIDPDNFYFNGQNEGEVVYMLLRRHFITNSGWVTNATLLAVLPYLLHALLLLFRVDMVVILGAKLLFIVGIIYYSVILTTIVKNFIDWYFNLYFITNERVLDYDFKSFVSNRVTEANFISIEDVKESTIGFIPNLFNYGTVEMFTEGDHNPITFHDVPDPAFVRDKVSDLAKIAKNLQKE